MIKKISFYFLPLILLLMAGCTLSPFSKAKVADALEEAVTQAFLLQAEEKKNEEIVFLLYETRVDYIEFNQDQTQALVWFALLDAETGEPNGTEPGLVLAELINDDPTDPTSWSMTFQHEPEWAMAVWESDVALLTVDEKLTYSGKAQTITHETAQIYTGYKLPWAAGERTKLSGSIAHVFIYKTCPTTCLYAFDFWTGDMFPIHAAKGGVVKFAKWDVPNGETTATNYLLVEDATTEPTTYAIYYHMAYDSIPEELRTPGAAVYQGQFIGNADDTGASTAHHLHFMVHTNPSSYWGSSVDILFDEVDINDGRPRTCNEAELFPEYGDECHEGGDWFYSENIDNPPPSAWIESPVENTTITASQFSVIAAAEDDMVVQTISLFIRQGNAGWQEVAESQNQNTLTAEINLCELGLEDGAFELALEVVDSAGKVTRTYDTPHTLNKQFDCLATPPECQPETHQIALYTEANYKGNCTLVTLGDYYGMIYIDGIENDEVSSLLVGNHTYTILFADNNLKGIYEVFFTDDPDLSDNVIQANAVSSLKVGMPPSKINPPQLPPYQVFYEGELVEVNWSGDAAEYFAELQFDGEVILQQDWSSLTNFTMGFLQAGEYDLMVKARNYAGEATTKVELIVIQPEKEIPSTKLYPLPSVIQTSVVELSWDVASGIDNIKEYQVEYQIDEGEWHALASIPAEDTSTIVILSANHTYGFRLRAVAITGPSEKFPEKAQTKVTIEEACIPDIFEEDDRPENAAQLTQGEPQLHFFCPSQDVDWIAVEAISPRKVTIEIDPFSNQIPLMAAVYSPDGTLTDTIMIYQERSDIHIAPKENESGIWQIELKPYDPLVFGMETAYQVEMKSLFFQQKMTPLFQISLVVLLCAVLLAVLLRRRN
ncbi:MAG: peptidoglycan DD-metalloendopeptidase family protein [Anaerolineae bacterium]|nr:peptidoglycan DD-metalloendopeptidase family protein [Anaerolineae bacterium]